MQISFVALSEVILIFLCGSSEVPLYKASEWKGKLLPGSMCYKWYPNIFLCLEQKALQDCSYWSGSHVFSFWKSFSCNTSYLAM